MKTALVAGRLSIREAYLNHKSVLRFEFHKEGEGYLPPARQVGHCITEAQSHVNLHKKITRAGAGCSQCQMSTEKSQSKAGRSREQNG